MAISVGIPRILSVLLAGIALQRQSYPNLNIPNT